MTSWESVLQPNLAGVYLIEQKVGRHKCYIGSAVDLRRRRSEHIRQLRRKAHDNWHLQRAWGKYGPSAFEFRILLFCDGENALFYEQCALDFYTTKIGWRNMFNQDRIAGSRLGSPHSEETIQKMRDNNTRHFLGKHHSEVARKKMSELSKQRWRDHEYRARCTGRMCSEETREKIRKAAIGRSPSPETREKLRAAMIGRVVSDETKRKLAKSTRNLGHRTSEETKKKISAALAGREFSEELRKKISDGVKLAKARKRAAMTEYVNKVE